MKKTLILKLLLALVIIAMASIYLPEFYWKTFPHRYYLPRVAYSPILNDLLITKGDFKKARILDLKGNSYSSKQYETLVPQTAFAQLVFLGKLPDTVNGVAFTVPELRKNLFRINFEPVGIDAIQFLMYPLIESKPNRASLSFPHEFFSIKKEFMVIDSRSNSVLDNMSNRYSLAFIDRGFKFPAKELFGNPTTRKPFDEGYFVIDNEDNFFHLKRVEDEPYVRKINLPDGVKVAHMVVAERDLREFYGFFVTEDNRLFMIENNTYHLVELPISDYNYKTSLLSINADILYRRVSIINDNKITALILDRNYKVITTFKDSVTHKDETKVGQVASFIFPFTLQFTSENSQYINLYPSVNGFNFIVVNIILSVLFLLFLMIRKFDIKSSVLPIIIIIVTGIYGVIAVSVLRDFKKKNSAGVSNE